MDQDGEWMTWAEAADRLGIKPESVKRRARARRWARRTGNDGKASVKVPNDVLQDAPPDVRAAVLPDQSDVMERAIRAEARADAAEKMLENMTEERDRWRDMSERLSHPKVGIITRLLGRIG